MLTLTPRSFKIHINIKLSPNISVDIKEWVGNLTAIPSVLSKILLALLSPSCQLPEQCLKLGHDNFLPQPSILLFTIIQSLDVNSLHYWQHC